MQPEDDVTQLELPISKPTDTSEVQKDTQQEIPPICVADGVPLESLCIPDEADPKLPL